MRRLITLQGAAALAVAGIGVGIFAGNAAIDAIDPHFYSPLPSASYASLSPYRNATTGAPAPIEASAETPYAYGDGCVGCRAYPEEYHPESAVEQVPDDYYAASLGAPAGYRQASAETTAAPEEPDEERAAVERYASYRVVEPAVAAERQVATFADAEQLRQAEEETSPRGAEPPVY